MCRIFIDSQKALDTFTHELLLEILNHWAIRSTESDWFCCFLANRKQYVSINGFLSEAKIVRCGVPKGSTSWLLLFLIYINDLEISLDKCIVYHLADDTNFLFGNQCPSQSLMSWIMS